MSSAAEGRAAAERFRRDHHLTMRDPKRGAVFIGVARTRDPMQQRSTLAHELGHVRFEDGADNGPVDWSARTPAEIRADAFARHLLVPIEGLREFVTEGCPLPRSALSAVVQRFLVSPQIGAIALHQAGYISETAKRNWMRLTTPQLAHRFGWSDHYRVLQADSDKRRAPQRLLARAVTAYAEGVLSAQAIATLRGITVEEVQEELREAGVAPTDRPVAWSDHTDLPDVDTDMAALDELLNAPDEDGDPLDAASKDGG